jgi:hypothetical protein
MPKKKFFRRKIKNLIWIIRALTVLVVFLHITLLNSGYYSVSAQSKPVIIEVIPPSVELPITGEVAETLAVIRNNSEDILQNVRLTWFSNINVNVEVNKLAVRTIPPGGELAWTLKLSQSKNELITGKIYLRLDYIVQPRNNRAAISKIVSEAIEVKSREIEKVNEIINVDLKITLETLNDNRSTLSYLILTNQSAVPISVIKILPSGPDFISFNQIYYNSGTTQGTLTQPTFVQRILKLLSLSVNSNSNVSQEEPILFEPPLLLQPHTTYSIPVEVKAKQRVNPGKHTLIFNIEIQWKQDEATQTGNIIKAQEVEVGVFGESAILELLQVPSLFVLPGFLVLMTIKQLWKSNIFRANDEKSELSLEPTNAEFWFFGIIISIVIALLYPLIIGQNYFEEYGLGDIFGVWIFSLGLGAIIFLIWMIMRKLHRQRVIPNPIDDEITILMDLL